MCIKCYPRAQNTCACLCLGSEDCPDICSDVVIQSLNTQQLKPSDLSRMNVVQAVSTSFLMKSMWRISFVVFFMNDILLES